MIPHVCDLIKFMLRLTSKQPASPESITHWLSSELRGFGPTRSNTQGLLAVTLIIQNSIGYIIRN